MTKLNLTQNEKLALKEFKEKILQKFKEEVLDIKLFGSKARGDFKPFPDSDIDVLVLLKKNSPEKEDLITEIATDISLKYTLDISPKIFSKKEYKERLKLQIPFFLIIEKEGISLCNLK